MVVETWLTHLLVSECSIIAFNDSIVTFGSGDTMVKMSGNEGEKTQQIRKWLLELKPVGFTNTLEALQYAYRFKQADTIILFTDGEPRLQRTGQAPLDFQMRDEITACSSPSERSH